MFKDIPYVVDRDFAPIASVSDAPMVLATNGKSPYKTVGDVIAAAKAQPDKINVALPSNTARIVYELFKARISLSKSRYS